MEVRNLLESKKKKKISTLTGYEWMKWFCEYCHRPKIVIIVDIIGSAVVWSTSQPSNRFHVAPCEQWTGTLLAIYYLSISQRTVRRHFDVSPHRCHGALFPLAFPLFRDHIKLSHIRVIFAWHWNVVRLVRAALFPFPAKCRMNGDKTFEISLSEGIF